MLPEIIYQDKYLLALNKPGGLLSVPGRGADKQDCLASRVQAVYPEAKVVHRLDCFTSGIMIMALGIDVQRELARQFHDRLVSKEYIAVVHGKPDVQCGTIDIPMRGDPACRPWQVIDYRAGKNALTHWQLIGGNATSSRLLLRPVTGRTHQLRLHCRELGYPIVGDRLYGIELDAESDRMLLHAETIAFIHPASGERVRLTASCDF